MKKLKLLLEILLKLIIIQILTCGLYVLYYITPINYQYLIAVLTGIIISYMVELLFKGDD